MGENIYSKITPEILEMTELCRRNGKIDPELYAKLDVKRGLRDINGKGVLAGLTEIADVHAYNVVDGKTVPCDGQLFYRGYDVEGIVKGFPAGAHNGFEEVTYLLLFGELPTQNELNNFCDVLGYYRSLPPNFVRDIIMKKASKDMMNTLARSVLMLYAYDDNPDDISVPNVLRQSLQLIAQFPMLAVYGYRAYQHYWNDDSLIIHNPDPKLSTAENILKMLRRDEKYTPLEAKLLDLALVLHAEHGGGNNSTFTTHVVTSTGTDTYSSIVASLGSLKGPRHGGANIRVMKMMADLKDHVHDWKDKDALRNYLDGLLNKQGFDRSGLIYGMGHAVYSLSDPRARVLKRFTERLSQEKGCEEEYHLYCDVAEIAADLISRQRKIYKGVSANVDFYSGFVYQMLDLPMELYTPIFAIARISGWCAHRIEELVNDGKIIRPAYKNVLETRQYVEMKDRK